MKRVLLVFCVILALFFVPIRVLANDDVIEPEQTENEIEAENEPTLDDFKAEVQAWMEQYMEESMVAKIITWLVDAGVLSALFAVYLKYRKYKHTTIEDLTKQFGDKVGEWLKENFDKLSAEQIQGIKDTINKLEQSNETMMKVLILMQDNTAKGKAALLEYLGSKTDNVEVKQAVAEVGEALDQKEKAEEIVKQKVSGEYEEIF